jgi:hypothetical protein
MFVRLFKDSSCSLDSSGFIRTHYHAYSSDQTRRDSLIAVVSMSLTRQWKEETKIVNIF